MARPGSSQEMDREGTLITENFGGLNTESAPNDLPDGDSPNMMNVEVNTNGLLVKRRGTNWRIQHTSSGFRNGRGHTIMTHKLKKGHIIVCEKLQTGLRWGVAQQSAGGSNQKAGGLGSIGLMSQVFSSRAADSRASWVVTPDPVPRLLIATGENTVVEVALYEQLITTTGSSVGTMNITDDVLSHTRFHTVSGTTYTVLISDAGTVTTVTSTSRAAKVVTLNFSGTLPAGNYTVFRPVWSYWTEAITVAPEQLYDYVVQPSVAAIDADPTGAFDWQYVPQLAVEIPEPLRRGITPFNTNGDRPYTMYNNNDIAPTINIWDGTAGNIQRWQDRDDAHVYSGGAGAQNNDDYINSGDTHVVFGRANGGTGASAPVLPARFIHICRAYLNPFLDGANQLRAFEIGSYQNPYVGGVGRFIPANIHSDNGSPGSVGNAYWFNTGETWYRGYTTSFGYTAAGGVAATMGNTRLGYWSMSGSFPFGINDGSFSWFRIQDIGGSTFLHIGTDRALVNDDYSVGASNVVRQGASNADYQGTCLPISGLWEFCNFNNTGNYDFPSIISYYQGRVILSGFRYSPNLVAMSNVTNNYEYFTNAFEREVNRNFGALYSDVGLGFSPIQVFLDVDTSERITNITATNDALVCFTQNNTVAITGVNGSNVIPTAYVQNRVSKVGCVNFKCAVNTELGIIFLSRSGVYFLKPVQETGAYQTVSLSLKIQRIIDASTAKNEGVAWMAYDQAKSTVYVGISDGQYEVTCTRLLVLNVLRNAWTEYGLTGGYWMSNDGSYIDSRMFIDFNIFNDRTAGGNNANNSVNILELYANHFLDWAFFDLGNAFTGSYSLPIPNHTNYLTLDANQKTYSTNVSYNPTSCGAVRPIPIRQLLETDFVNVDTATRYNDWVTVSGTGVADQSTEITGDFSTLQVDKNANESFSFADSVTFTTGHTLRTRLRDYNQAFDTSVPIYVTIDNVRIQQTGSPNYTVTDTSGNTTYSITPSASYTVNQIVFIGAGIPTWWFSPVYDRQRNNQIKRITHVTSQFRNRDQQQYRASDRNTAASQSSSVLSDKYKFDANASVAILYDNTFDSTYEMDLYRLTDVLDTFSTDRNKARRDQYTRVVSPVIGSSYSLQLAIFSFDNTYFELSAYQMVTKPKGRSSRSSQDMR